ncbi:hypothetical protein pb186bvf_016304 [Paramecium bursaria]
MIIHEVFFKKQIIQAFLDYLKFFQYKPQNNKESVQFLKSIYLNPFDSQELYQLSLDYEIQPLAESLREIYNQIQIPQQENIQIDNAYYEKRKNEQAQLYYQKIFGLALMSTLSTQVRNVEFRVKGKLDEYQSFHIESLQDYIGDIQRLKTDLRDQINQFRQLKYKAVWVKLEENQLQFAQSLIDLGFEMHHCKEDYLLFSQWLIDGEQSRLPGFTTHYVGAGGVVIKDDKILIVQEKNGTKQGYWGIPNGHVDDKELVIEGAVREVKEETNLDVEPKDIFLVREIANATFGKSDLYFVVMMHLKDPNQQVQIQDAEIMNYQWLPILQISNFLKGNNVGPTQVILLKQIQEYYQKGLLNKQMFEIKTGSKLYYGVEKKFAIYKPKM